MVRKKLTEQWQWFLFILVISNMATWTAQIPYGGQASITYNNAITYNLSNETYGGKTATVWTAQTKSP